MVRFLHIDLTVNCLNPLQLSVTLDVGVTRCGDIKREDLDTDQ